MIKMKTLTIGDVTYEIVDAELTDNVVMHKEQNLTEEQKAQARENIGAAAIGETGASEAIIDVTSLPTENIDENAFYRLLTGTFVYNQYVQNAYTVYCVEGLPEVGEPATNADMSMVTAYYNVQDGDAYGYVDAMLSQFFGVPIGWYPVSMLFQAAGWGYSGIIANILDDPCDSTVRLLLEYVIYSYKDGWTYRKTIGWVGTGSNAEVFNHPSNKATGDASHAEGNASHAEGCYSHAEGSFSHAEGDRSHAEGKYSHAEGNYSHAEGDSSHAEGDSSHAEGYASHVEGNYSHAEGWFSHAEGWFSHAEGYASHAEGKYSHAEGYGYRININITGDANTTIYTVNTTDNLIVGASIRHTVTVDNVPTYYTAKIIAIDHNNRTVTVNRTLSEAVALSNQSVYVYVAGMALGNNSHSEGNQTVAAGRSQHVQGEFNIVDPEYDVNDNSKRGKYAHIVGNGTSHTDRSNAHTLDWNGNAWFAGDVYVGGSGQDDATAEKLATEAYVNIRVPAWTEADEGKFLRIVNGTPAWVSIPNAEEAEF